MSTDFALMRLEQYLQAGLVGSLTRPSQAKATLRHVVWISEAATGASREGILDRPLSSIVGKIAHAGYPLSAEWLLTAVQQQFDETGLSPEVDPLRCYLEAAGLEVGMRELVTAAHANRRMLFKSPPRGPSSWRDSLEATERRLADGLELTPKRTNPIRSMDPYLWAAYALMQVNNPSWTPDQLKTEGTPDAWPSDAHALLDGLRDCGFRHVAGWLEESFVAPDVVDWADPGSGTSNARGLRKALFDHHFASLLWVDVFREAWDGWPEPKTYVAIAAWFALLGERSLHSLGAGPLLDALDGQEIAFLSAGSGFVVARAGHSGREVAYAWGANDRGQLGTGLLDTAGGPARVALPPGACVASVAAGISHALAVDQDGRLYAWGRGGQGQLGDGGAEDRGSPIEVVVTHGARAERVVFSEVRANGDTSEAYSLRSCQLWRWGRVDDRWARDDRRPRLVATKRWDAGQLTALRSVQDLDALVAYALTTDAPPNHGGRHFEPSRKHLQGWRSLDAARTTEQEHEDVADLFANLRRAGRRDGQAGLSVGYFSPVRRIDDMLGTLSAADIRYDLASEGASSSTHLGDEGAVAPFTVRLAGLLEEGRDPAVDSRAPEELRMRAEQLVLVWAQAMHAAWAPVEVSRPTQGRAR